MTDLFAACPDTRLVTDDIERRIVDAAATCFIRDGAGKTTMVAIAQEAGVGVATVYRRFGHKENLVEVTLLMEVHRFTEALTERLATTGDLEDQLAEAFATFVAAVVDRPLLIAALEHDEAANFLPILTTAGSPLLAVGTAYVEHCIAQWQIQYGVAVGYDVGLIAEIFARLAHSIALTPGGRIPIRDQAAARSFARTYLLPLLHPVSGGRAQH